MTIVLIILCILLLLPFIGIILEALCAIIGYGIGAAMIGGLIFLLIIGAKFLGFIYSLCLIIAFLVLITIYNNKSNGNTWGEAISYSTAVFLPLLILWFIPIYFIERNDLQHIVVVFIITAFISSIFALAFIFDTSVKDSKTVVQIYCGILILVAIFHTFVAIFYWSITIGLSIMIGIISVIIFMIGYEYHKINRMEKKDKPDEEKAFNENTF